MGGLPAGMERRPLDPHRDDRGSFTEVFRESWKPGAPAVQWNLVESFPGTVRGVHVHVRHLDYWVLVRGRAAVGFRDLRTHSPTFGVSGALYLLAEVPELIVIPPGVAHGFQFHECSLHVYAVTHYWDPADELGCRWDDPALDIPWPAAEARVSPRDRDADALAALMLQLAPHQEALHAPPAGP